MSAHNRVQVDNLIIDFSTFNAYLTPSSKKSNRDTIVELDEKSLTLLQILVSNADSGASRDTLLSEIWHDKVVSDDSLTNLVSVTRAKLKPLGCSIIKTLPKRGYIIDGEVTYIEQETPSGNKSTGLSNNNILKTSLVITIVLALVVLIITATFNKQDEAYQQSIAVLPIESFSEEAFIRNGAKSFTEELIHSLSNYPALNVVSRTLSSQHASSEATYSEISQALNSRFFIEGSIRIQGTTLRLTVQFIDGESGMHIFSRVIDTTLNEFKLKREEIIQSVSRVIVSEVPVNFSEQKQLIEKDTYQERCESYLAIANLYKERILSNVESIAASAEGACISLAQISPSDASAQSKIAQLYSVMAQSSTKNRDQLRGYNALGQKYVTRALDAEPYNETALEIEAQLLLNILVDAFNSDRDADKAFLDIQKQVNVALDMYPQNTRLLNISGASLRRYGVEVMNRGENPQPYFEQAASVYQAGILSAPDSPDFYHNLARLKKSQTLYLIAQKLDPSTTFEQSIKNYRLSMKFDPNSPVILLNLAKAHASYAKWLALNNMSYLKHFEYAREAYDAIFKSASSLVRAYVGRSFMETNIAQINIKNGKSATQAIENGKTYANKALSLQPDYLWTHLNLINLNFLALKQDYLNGEVSISSGMACIDAGEAALNIKKSHADTWLMLAKCGHINARIYIEQKQLKAAEKQLAQTTEYLNQALIINNKSHSIWTTVATNQLLQGYISPKKEKFKEILNSLDESLTLQPNSDEARMVMIEAMLFFMKKDMNIDEAILSENFTQLEAKYSHSPRLIIMKAIHSGEVNSLTTYQELANRLTNKLGITANDAIRQLAPLITN